MSDFREEVMGRPWFGAKTYGIGIGPKRPAAWVAILVYVALMTAAPLAELALRWPIWAIPATFALLTLAFLALVVLTSDRQPLRWRWGGR
jgi:hypothetical protein